MLKSLISLDLDGTLLDANILAEQSLHNASKLLTDFNIKPDLALEGLFKLRPTYSSGKPHTLFSKYCAQNGINDNDLVNRMVREFNRTMQTSMSYIKPFPGTEDTLRELSEKYDLAIVTNGTVKTQFQKVYSLKLSRYFVRDDGIHIHCSYNNSNRQKPHPIMWKEAGNNLSVHVGERVFEDIYGANRFGIESILIGQRADVHVDKIKNFFGHTVKNYEDLLVPNVRIDDITDLPGIL